MKRRKNLCTGYWKRRAGGKSLQGALLYYASVRYGRDKKSKQSLSRLWYLRSNRVIKRKMCKPYPRRSTK